MILLSKCLKNIKLYNKNQLGYKDFDKYSAATLPETPLFLAFFVANNILYIFFGYFSFCIYKAFLFIMILKNKTCRIATWIMAGRAYRRPSLFNRTVLLKTVYS